MKKIIIILTLLITASYNAYASNALAEFTPGESVPRYVLRATTFNATNSFTEGELVVVLARLVDLDQTVTGYVFAEYVEQVLANLAEVIVRARGSSQSFRMVIANDELGKINQALFNNNSFDEEETREVEMGGMQPDFMEVDSTIARIE